MRKTDDRLRRAIGLSVLACIALLCSACSGGAAQSQKEVLAPPLVSTDLNADGRTNKPAQVRALPGSGYSVEPLVTVGDEIPLLTGVFPGGNCHPKRTYGLPGIPDGLGLAEHSGNYFIWMNHEISSGSLSKYSKTISGQINGARVSILKFNEDWEIVGGRNLIEHIYDKSGLIGEVTLNDEKTE